MMITKTCLFSAGIEKVFQLDDVAVFQAPHNLQLAILERTKKTKSSVMDTDEIVVYM